MLFQQIMGDIEMSSQYKVAVFGDHHLRSRDSQPQVVDGMLNFIEYTGCQRLILNGDIVDEPSLDSREQAVWQRFVNLSSSMEVSLVFGNHDTNYSTSGLEMGNISTVEDVTLEVGDKKFYVAHGHLSDDSLHHQKEWWVRWLVSLYPYFSRREWFYHNYIYGGGIWRERSERIAQNGLRLGIEKGVDVVIFSHTHRPLFRRNGKVVYYNLGCACEWERLSPRKSVLGTIDLQGNVALHQFSVDGEYLGVLDLAA